MTKHTILNSSAALLFAAGVMMLPCAADAAGRHGGGGHGGGGHGGGGHGGGGHGGGGFHGGGGHRGGGFHGGGGRGFHGGGGGGWDGGGYPFGFCGPIQLTLGLCGAYGY